MTEARMGKTINQSKINMIKKLHKRASASLPALLWLMLLALLPAQLSARDFTYTYEGQTLTYTVLDEEARTVETIKGWDDYSAGNPVSGDLVIPATVSDGTNEYTVTAIGYRSFNRCYYLTSVKIPGSVTSVGYRAFYWCGLKEFTVADGDNEIEFAQEALYRSPIQDLYIGRNWTNYPTTESISTGIKTVTLGNKVTALPDYAFSGCTDLTSIEFSNSNSVTSIGDNAFYDCKSLTSIELPGSVTSIGNNAFYYCESLTSVELPASLTSIGKEAFCLCTGLTGLEIPNSVTSIGSRAFSGCTSLTSIEIPGSVTSIGEYAFEYCYNLKKFTLADADNVISFGMRALNNCPIEDLYIGRNWTYYYGDSSISTGIKTVTLGNKVTVLPDGAFSGCTSLTSIDIPNSVTSIGSRAFSGCTSLTSIELPGSVTSIGEYAFYQCEQLRKFSVADSDNEISFGPNVLKGCSIDVLYIGRNWKFTNDYNAFSTDVKTVALGDKVTALPDCAFYKCTGFTSIEIPNSVTSIGNLAFCVCTSLTSIKIPNSVTSIGENAFGGCTSLTSIEIPNSVTSIGGDVFSDCTSLASIDIPNSVTSIGWGAFSGCTGLTNIDIPNSVTSIGWRAFDGCTSLTNIDIPNSVTSIESSTFRGCSSLTSIDIPGSVTSIEREAFSGCTSLTQLNVAATTPPDVYSNTFDEEMYEKVRLNVPDDAMLSYVTHSVWRRFNNIGDQKIDADIFENGGFKYRVFAENSLMLIKGDYSALTEANLTKRVAYKGKFYYVKAIGTGAFEGCANLTMVVLNDDVLLIADNAFKGCSKLSDINWPSSLTALGNSAFYGCTALTNAVIGNSVASIGEYAFYGCTALTNAVIGNSVASIGRRAFSGCKGLTSIELPNTVTSIGNNAFYGCSRLTTIVVGNSVTSIGNSAFEDCTALKGIELPNTVTSIGESAFMNCYYLTTAEIGNSVTSIGKSAFEMCRNLRSIEIPNTVTSIESRTFYLCDLLYDFEIPNSVTSIGESAFYSCRNLPSIEIPGSVTSVGADAFSDCGNMKKIIIADSDNEIAFGRHVFLGCNTPDLYIGRNWTHEIPYYPFPGGIKTVTLGNKVTALPNNAFTDRGLESINLPGSLSSLDLSVFDGCPWLKFMSFDYGDTPLPIAGNLPQNVEKLCIDRELSSESFNAANVREVEFGNIVTVIPANLFKGCANLSSLTLGSSILTIGEGAFQNCGLTGVTLSPKVTSVGANAFNGNPLASVTIGSNVAEIGANAFGKAGVGIDNVYISARNIPEAADNSFSDYNGQLWVMPGMAEEYYNSIPCFYMFEKGKDMVEADDVTIGFDAPAEGLKPGDTVQLTATVAPANVTLDRVFWSSTNPAIATVDNNGLVKFHGENAARAYAAGDDAECKIIATTLYADGPIAEVSISGKGVTSGIDDVFGDSDAEIQRPNDIYTLQGVCLKRNASQADIDALTPGIYIIAGKKVLVK